MKTHGYIVWSATNRLDTKYEPKWYVEIAVSREDAKILSDIGLKVKVSEDDEGNIVRTFRAERKEARKKGKAVVGTNPAPIVVDAALNPFDGILGKGTEVYVVHRPYSWDTGKSSGWSSDLQKVQILNLVPYEGGDDTGGDSPVIDDTDDELKIEGEGIGKSASVATVSTKAEEDMPF